MALKVKRMADLALKGKRVLIREDLNVPVKDGKVTSTARIDAALPTLKQALDAGVGPETDVFALACIAFATRLRWLSMAPFDSPVVPPV